MLLSRDEIATAEAMHRFVQQYETQRKVQWGTVAWALPLVLVSFATSLRHDPSMGRDYLMVAGVVLFIGYVAERHRAIRYREAKIILGIIEREHSDELPWFKDAIILDAAREIEQEVAKAHAS
jgi:hypothetical protein